MERKGTILSSVAYSLMTCFIYAKFIIMWQAQQLQKIMEKYILEFKTTGHHIIETFLGMEVKQND